MLTKIVRDLFQSMLTPRGAKDKRAFHIVGIMPSGKTLHAMKGLTEVMESVAWGLRQLGYSAHIAVNDIARDRTNIIFGAQLLQPKFIEGLPAGTVIYNLEQVIDLDLFENPVVRAIAAHCHIWEYSEPQVQKWIQLGAAAHRVIHVPIGWSPTLQRIVKPQVQDIDVLIYGMPSALRAKVFKIYVFKVLSPCSCAACMVALGMS